MPKQPPPGPKNRLRRRLRRRCRSRTTIASAVVAVSVSLTSLSPYAIPTAEAGTQDGRRLSAKLRSIILEERQNRHLLHSKISPTSPLDSLIPPTLGSSSGSNATAPATATHDHRTLFADRMPQPLHTDMPPRNTERLHNLLHPPISPNSQEKRIHSSHEHGPVKTNRSSKAKPVTVSLRLKLPSVGQSKGQVSKEEILHEQTSTIAKIREMNDYVEVLGQTQVVLNAVFLRFPHGISSTDLAAITNRVEGVKRVTPMGNYRVDMLPTEEHIGAKAAQNLYGYDGTGVRVAVLDTGVDYTHKNLGGKGTVDAYIDAMGIDPYDSRNRNRDGIFPTPKVVDGFDFVGEVSAGEDDDEYIEFDDDPIDAGGHGTSVADTIAGINGVAPGASIVALKVCAAQGGCPGISIAMGIEYAVENDVDIINLSLGSDYGQAFDDELVYAIDSASAMGVLTVASSANCGDNPYCTGTPGSAFSAMSVAQTTVPGEFTPWLYVDDNKYEAAHFTWSPSVNERNSFFQGEIQYGDGNSRNTDGCEPFSPGSLKGKIVLVDRGDCFFSDKTVNIQKAGGVATIVANDRSGPPFPGGFGGGSYPRIPAYMVTLESGDEIREAIKNGEKPVATLDYRKFLATTLTVSKSSARGPDMSYNRIKPELGAPGANMVAEFGTGDEETIFGGTSGAAPVVAGAACLCKQVCPDCSPLALKAMLMNTAFRNITSDTNGGPAEITRIGAGELRANHALAATFVAYSPDESAPSFSLGLLEVTEDITIRRKMKIVNLLEEEQTISFSWKSRLEENKNKIDIEMYNTDNTLIDEIALSTCDDTIVEVVFHINSANIEPNHMNSGSHGDDPAKLGKNEVDGYVILSAGSNDVGIPYHALARRAAKVIAKQGTLTTGFPEMISLKNKGAGSAQVDVFDMVGLSDDLPEGAPGSETPTPDIRAVGVRTLLADRSECEGGFALEFAINTWERQAHLMPVTYYIFIDTNDDGEVDYAVWNGLSDDNEGKIQTIATALEDYHRSAKYFAEHATNSANTVLRVCSEQIGLSLEEDIFSGERQNLYVEVEAYDYLYGGPGDVLTAFTIKPFGERFTDNAGIEASTLWPLRENELPDRSDISPGKAKDIPIYDMLKDEKNKKRRDAINKHSLGALVFTNSNRGEGARGAATQETEALLLLAPGVESPKAYESDEKQEKKNNNLENDSTSSRNKEGIVCRASKLTAVPSRHPTPAPTVSPTISKEPTYTPTSEPSIIWPTWSPTAEEDNPYRSKTSSGTADSFMPTSSPTLT